MKAVTDGVLRHVSASQITTFARCPRKWWYEKVAGFKQPETEALARGTRVHAEIEAWLEEAKQPVTSSVQALVAHPNFPARPTHRELEHTALVEHPRDYNMGLELAGVPVRGRIDFLDYRSPPTVDIWDWKTTGKWANAKTAEQLEHNIQLMLYAEWVFQNPKAADVRCHHGYVLTSGTGARIVSTGLLDREHVAREIAQITEVVERMKIAAACSEADQVDANPDACRDFGGCPFRNVCNRGAASVADQRRMLFEAEERKTMSLSQKLAGGINPPDAAPTQPRPSPAPTKDAPPAVLAPPPVGLHLYVNVAPLKGTMNVTHLEDLIAKHAADICAEAGVKDLRLVEYGKGKGYLAQAMRENPPTGIVLAQSGELADAAIEALIPLASVYIRGVPR